MIHLPPIRNGKSSGRRAKSKSKSKSPQQIPRPTSKSATTSPKRRGILKFARLSASPQKGVRQKLSDIFMVTKAATVANELDYDSPEMKALRDKMNAESPKRFKRKSVFTPIKVKKPVEEESVEPIVLPKPEPVKEEEVKVPEESSEDTDEFFSGSEESDDFTTRSEEVPVTMNPRYSFRFRNRKPSVANFKETEELYTSRRGSVAQKPRQRRPSIGSTMLRLSKGQLDLLQEYPVAPQEETHNVVKNRRASFDFPEFGGSVGFSMDDSMIPDKRRKRRRKVKKARKKLQKVLMFVKGAKKIPNLL